MVQRVSQIAVAACVLLLSVHAQVSAQTKSANPSTSSGRSTATPAFAPLEQWKAAVLSGDAAKLRAIYSTNPAARVVMPTGEAGAETEIAFWTGLKVRRLKIDLQKSETQQPGLQQVAFEAEVVSGAQSKPQTVYVIDGQLWQKQGDQWRIVATQRSAPSKLQQPLDTSRNIYVPGLNAHAEIAQALKLAAQQHKRLLVVFGANWCYDCHVLDLAFHRPDVAAVLGPNFEVVHVDVGEYDKNLDIMQQFQVPKERGIPAIAVLGSDGKLLYSQKGGEFEKARSLSPEDVLAFLNQWKPK